MLSVVILALLSCTASSVAVEQPAEAGQVAKSRHVRQNYLNGIIPEGHTLPKLTSFEMGCYYVDDPAGEEGGAKGRSYRGLVSYAESGRTCMNWEDIPTAELKKEDIGPASDVQGEDGTMTWGNGLGNHNYCRNPTGDESRPWCYTVDPKLKKEPCMIDMCDYVIENGAMVKKKAVDYEAVAKKLGTFMKDGGCGFMKDDPHAVPGVECPGTSKDYEGAGFLQHTRK